MKSSTPAENLRWLQHEGETLVDDWRRRPASAPPVGVLLLCGRDDPFLVEAQQAQPALGNLGVTVEWTETPGGHDWSTWRAQLSRVLPRLFR